MTARIYSQLANIKSLRLYTARVSPSGSTSSALRFVLKVGTMNASITTTIANVSTSNIIGYANAPLTFFFIDKSFS